MPKTFACILLGLLIVGVYANALDNEFVFDDFLFIESETIRRPISQWPSFFTLHRHKQVYRPLRTLSYAIDYQLGGEEPFAYHAANVVYHWLAACLVFFVSLQLAAAGRGTLMPRAGPLDTLQEINSSRRAGHWSLVLAGATAAAWAVHPIQTDAVAYVSGRRDILAGVFFFLGFYAFVRLRTLEQSAWRRRGLWTACAIGAFFLGALSKEVVLIFPLLFFSYDLCREYVAQQSVWQNITYTSWTHRWLYLPFFPICLLGAGYYLPYLSQILKWHGGGPLATWSTIPRIWVHYLQLLVFPKTLNADYSNAFSVSPYFWEGRAFVALVTIGLLFAGILWALRKGHRLVAFCGLWFFITLLPMSQIIPHHELLAEHYLYIPSFGFVLLGCLGLVYVSQRWRREVGIGACLVLLVCYGARTIARNQDWQDEVSLWQKTVQTAPTSFRAHHNLGVALREKKKDLAGAKRAFQRALEIHPRYASAYTGLAEVHLDELRYDEALIAAQKAVELKPSRVWSQWILGQVYFRRGEYADAIRVLHKVIALDWNFIPAYKYLARLYRMQGNIKEAHKWQQQIPSSSELPPVFRYGGRNRGEE